jgi:hypothetical protein
MHLDRDILHLGHQVLQLVQVLGGTVVSLELVAGYRAGIDRLSMGFNILVPDVYWLHGDPAAHQSRTPCSAAEHEAPSRAIDKRNS